MGTLHGNAGSHFAEKRIRRSIRTPLSHMRPTFCWSSLLALFFFGLAGAQDHSNADSGEVPQAQFNPDAVRVNVTEGDDVRFLRLSGIEGPSQNRVTQIVQDDTRVPGKTASGYPNRPLREASHGEKQSAGLCPNPCNKSLFRLWL
jgi:hypothetical protein